MKNYAKTGNRKGRPAYRTPATFRARLSVRNAKARCGRKIKQEK